MIRERVRFVLSRVATIATVALGIWMVQANRHYGWRVYLPIGIVFAFGAIMLAPTSQTAMIRRR